MPKGFKTITITDECDKLARAYFRKNVKQESFSRWLNNFIIKSMRKQIWNDHVMANLIVIDSDRSTITIADMESKEVIELNYESTKKIKCFTCDSKNCIHCEFIHRTLFEIELLENSPSTIYRDVFKSFFKS